MKTRTNTNQAARPIPSKRRAAPSLEMARFWGALTFAEAFGPEAVRETCERITREGQNNYKYFTRFVIVLNRKIWQHYNQNDTLARLYYNELWRAADNKTAEMNQDEQTND